MNMMEPKGVMTVNTSWYLADVAEHLLLQAGMGGELFQPKVIGRSHFWLAASTAFLGMTTERVAEAMALCECDPEQAIELISREAE